MYQLIQDLLTQRNCSREDILFVDFEDYRLADFTDADMDSLFTAFQQVAGKTPTFLPKLLKALLGKTGFPKCN